MNIREINEKTGQLLSLAGKVAVVTGAASGIGRGIALRLAEMGSHVAVLDINQQSSADGA
jgi:NAD(P)-dependent dehydrogenase (short-subunit alcohol dehydrogenase family)